MKKRILIITLFLFAFILTGATTNDLTERQNKVHEIAEIAREIGLEETDPIIKRAQELWWEAQALKEVLAEEDTSGKEDIPIEDSDIPLVSEPWYTEEDIKIVATVIYNEAWAGCSERHRELVGAVLVNRVKSPKFPNTVYACVVQPKQYNPGYATGRYPVPDYAWETCRELAIRALNGEVDCPDNVLFQSNFPNLGKGWYEVHYTSYSVSYFAYG